MIEKFPHLQGSTPYPGIANVFPYTYRNEFDYTRYSDTASVKLCCVPWCGDYTNVVKFEDDTARDAYLDALPGVSFETMFNLLPDTSIKVELPQASVQVFNYCIVDLPMLTSEDEPVTGADSDRVGRFCYFISDLKQAATNTTQCALQMDVWTTYIDRIEFTDCILERGHAPMAATDLDAYLENPQANSEYLSTPDAQIDDSTVVVRETNTVNYSNGEQWFVICTDAWPGATWGTLSGYTATTPCYDWNTTQGCPAPQCYGIEIDDAQSFFQDVEDECPQFMATIKCVFTVQKDLVVINPDEDTSCVFCGHTMNRLSATQEVRDLVEIDKDAFGFDEPYSEIAKLYTYPYSCIRIYSEDGSEQVVKIENLTGTLQIRTAVSLVFPYIAIDTHLLRIGGANFSTPRVGANAESSQWPFTGGGNFASYFQRHNIPCYYVVQSGADHATWAHLYDRRQAQIAADNALDSATTTANNNYDSATNQASNDLDSATTTAANERSATLALAQARYNNTVASASTDRTNAYNNAANMVATNTINVAANNDKVEEQNERALAKNGQSQTTQSQLTTYDNELIQTQLRADLEALAVAQQNNRIAATTGTISNALNTAGSYVQSVAQDGVAGVVSGVGAILSGVASEVDTLSSYAQAENTNAVTITNDENIAEANQNQNTRKTTTNNSLSNYVALDETYERINLANITNEAQTSITDNNADTLETNADNTYNTNVSNAARTYSAEQEAANDRYNAAINAANNAYDSATTTAANTRDAALNAANNAYDTATNAITNERAQQGLDAPYQCGQSMNGDTGATRPLATWAQVVTQSDGAIRYAGDQFLRYGYMLNQRWDIEDLNVMPHFSYWKCSDVWTRGRQDVLEGAQQVIRAIMENGVTVWKDPDEIGEVSIYDNI